MCSLCHTATHCNTLLWVDCTWKAFAARLYNCTCHGMWNDSFICNTLQHTSTHFNTLQHNATHCNTLQHAAELTVSEDHSQFVSSTALVTVCDMTHSYATHCNTLQLTATHYNTLLWVDCIWRAFAARVFDCDCHCNSLQRSATATHCNTLQHTATRCNTLLWVDCTYHVMWHDSFICSILQDTARYCNTLQHAATHCNTRCNILQYTATHCSELTASQEHPQLASLTEAVTVCDMTYSFSQSCYVWIRHVLCAAYEYICDIVYSYATHSTLLVHMQHTAHDVFILNMTDCNTMQHTATRSHTLTVARGITLQCNLTGLNCGAGSCNTLQ